MRLSEEQWCEQTAGMGMMSRLIPAFREHQKPFLFFIQLNVSVTCNDPDEYKDEVYLGISRGRRLTTTEDSTRRPFTNCKQNQVNILLYTPIRIIKPVACE